jgi:membrane-associated phospholipid phosphatase
MGMKRLTFGILLLIALGGFPARSFSAENNPASVAPGVSGVLEPLHRAEIEAQIRLQGSGNLGPLMRLISDLGVGKYNWIFIVLLFFFVSPGFAARFAIFFMAGLWLRELLALALQSPRPYWLDPRVLRLGPINGPASFGLPSGHAMMGSAFWVFLATEIRVRWAWIIATIMAVLIAFSRVYLGLHFFSDVTLGLLLGFSYCLLYRKIEPAILQWWWRAVPPRRLIFAVSLGASMLLAGLAVRYWLSSPSVPDPWGEFSRGARRLNPFADYGGALAGTGMALAFLKSWPQVRERWKWHLLVLLAAGAIAFCVPTRIASSVLKPVFPNWPESIQILTRFGFRVAEAWLVWFLVPRILLMGRESRAAITKM